MAEPLQIQPHAVPVEDFASSFFNHPPTDLRYEGTKYHPFYPTNAIRKGDPSNVVIPRWNGRTVWSRFFGAVQIAITNPDGSPLADNSVCAPINNVLMSAFKDIKTWLNGVNITPNSDNNGYKHYIASNLSYDTSSKQGFMSTAGWAEDTAEFFNYLSPSNDGFMERMGRFCKVVTNGDTVHTSGWNTEGAWFCGKLPLDFTHPIPNGIDVRFEFIPQEDKFFLMDNLEPYTFHIKSLVVFGEAQTLQAPVYDSIERRCKTEDMNLPFRRKEVMTHTVTAGSKSFNTDQLFAGRTTTPTRMIVGFVDETAYMGTKTKNPYKFISSFDRNTKLVSLKTTLNGEDIDGFALDNCDVLQFFRLQLLLGLTDGESNGLTSADFKNGDY